MKIVFQSEHFEEHKISDENLIRLFPYGLTLVQDPSRPTFLLKDESGQLVLPVSISPLEAGVALQQASQSILPTTPHKVTEVLLGTLNIKIEKCVFVEIKGHHQYVRLFLEGHPTHGSIKVRADEAMSLCLQLNVPLYSTRNFINRSRRMSAELDGMSQELSQGLQKNATNSLLLTKTHEYLI